ncbi:hypothetical protein SS50377_25430 [Spironucleus salmonicida]|uniref:Nucleotidyl transferase domain-containing protein n=1 Tax=Spironucleus salmonicida TaxID=348837 RepID=V6LMN5_9EUKA|nr:hypothetical protein SS50377_25430 [Spironucleus salmonicida]|eukprot:EST44976.1 Hypothetical protein SS50377_14995 [Spironucleus salmonicida]
MVKAIILCNKVQLTEQKPQLELSLLKLSNRPIIEYGICALAAAKIQQVYLITDESKQYYQYIKGLQKMYNVQINLSNDPNNILALFAEEKFIIYPGQLFCTFDFDLYCSFENFSKVQNVDIFIGLGREFLQEEKIIPNAIIQPQFYSLNQTLQQLIKCNMYIMQNFDVDNCLSTIQSKHFVINSCLEKGILLGNGVQIINSIIGENVIFEDNSKVENCYVETGIRIKTGNTFKDRIIVKE